MAVDPPKIIGNIPKLSTKWAAVVIPFFLSFLMSGIISMVTMLRNLGWTEGFFGLWFHNWMLAWAFAFPSVLLLLPAVRKLATKFVDIPPMK